MPSRKGRVKEQRNDGVGREWGGREGRSFFFLRVSPWAWGASSRFCDPCSLIILSLSLNFPSLFAFILSAFSLLPLLPESILVPVRGLFSRVLDSNLSCESWPPPPKDIGLVLDKLSLVVSSKKLGPLCRYFPFSPSKQTTCISGGSDGENTGVGFNFCFDLKRLNTCFCNQVYIFMRAFCGEWWTWVVCVRSRWALFGRLARVARDFSVAAKVSKVRRVHSV